MQAPWRTAAVIAGVALVVAVWRAAVLALVVTRPRQSRVFYTAWLRVVRGPVEMIARRVSYLRRDALLAPLAAVSMVTLVPFWLALFILGYALLFAGLGNLAPTDALREAGSSLLTLGFSSPVGSGQEALAFVAATTGPLLIGLLISYLPTLYGAFNRRETEVSLLAGRGGDPAWGPTILVRYHLAGAIGDLNRLFTDWERLMADVAESHTSYSSLVHFRSPDPRRSWLTGMIAVMDAAALQLARAPSTTSAAARLVITGGSSTLISLSRAQGLPVRLDPLPTDPLQLTYAEFQTAWHVLDLVGFPAETDCAGAWREFSGWRVNWEHQAYQMARRIQAPPVDWTGPRDGNLPRLTRDRVRNRRHDDIDGEAPPGSGPGLARRAAPGQSGWARRHQEPGPARPAAPSQSGWARRHQEPGPARPAAPSQSGWARRHQEPGRGRPATPAEAPEPDETGS